MRKAGIMSKVGTERQIGVVYARIMNQHRLAPSGSAEHRTWLVWYNMHRRCIDMLSKDYPRYGARGITVCPYWNVYAQFLADMGLAPEGKSLDRIDNHGRYEFGNCRWATKREQARNRRTNHVLCINGQKRTLAEWADSVGLQSSTIRARIKYNGGKVDESILVPVRKFSKKGDLPCQTQLTN